MASQAGVTAKLAGVTAKLAGVTANVFHFNFKKNGQFRRPCGPPTGKENVVKSKPFAMKMRLCMF